MLKSIPGKSMTGAEWIAVRDRTNEKHIAMAEERRRRDAKTERLRAARLQTEEQERQL